MRINRATPVPPSSTSKVSWLLVEITRSNTCSVKKAGTRNSRLMTKENAAMAPMRGRSSESRGFMGTRWLTGAAAAEGCCSLLEPRHGLRRRGGGGRLQLLHAAAQPVDGQQLFRIDARELLGDV